MKINDFILRYSFPNGYKDDGICRIRMFVNSSQQVIILITDLWDYNTSASVTNSVEVIYQNLKDKYGIAEPNIIIEHYEPIIIRSHTFDLVTLNPKDRTKWERLERKDMVQLLECNDELDNLTVENQSLLNQIAQLRTAISPHLGLSQPMDHEYILRLFNIQKNMIPKANLLQLINLKSNETAFLKLLRKDLSFFSEIYASPNDSYVCFSEFPINNGFVDFVLLTGVSRMDVFLIEIKGADVSFLTQNSYEKFNYKIDTAISQIRDRLRHIHEDISEFRKSVHDLRERAFKGEKIYNAFIGPNIRTLVDKEKDIKIHAVVIGGWTDNDLKESRKRHDFEENFRLGINLESWESFARKLQRK